MASTRDSDLVALTEGQLQWIQQRGDFPFEWLMFIADHEGRLPSALYRELFPSAPSLKPPPLPVPILETLRTPFVTPEIQQVYRALSLVTEEDEEQFFIAGRSISPFFFLYGLLGLAAYYAYDPNVSPDFFEKPTFPVMQVDIRDKLRVAITQLTSHERAVLITMMQPSSVEFARLLQKIGQQSNLFWKGMIKLNITPTEQQAAIVSLDQANKLCLARVLPEDRAAYRVYLPLSIVSCILEHVMACRYDSSNQEETEKGATPAWHSSPTPSRFAGSVFAAKSGAPQISHQRKALKRRRR